MNERNIFHPPRTLGFVFHAAATLLLLIASTWGFLLAAEADIGPSFVLYLLPALFSAFLVPLLVYRAYALRSARYILARDGIRIVWGFRSEDIPMNSIEWAMASRELGQRLPMPWIRWPGAVIGVRKTGDGKRLEFLASSSHNLVLIGLSERIFAISPEDSIAFLGSFQQFMELGAPTPIPAQSIYPSFFLARVWQTQLARYLLIGSLVLNLILLGWVTLAVPTHPQVILGFGPGREPVPGVRLLLLPVISSFFFLIDLLAGLFLFRRAEVQPSAPSTSTLWLVPGTLLAYMLWIAGLTVAVLFLAGVFFILQSG